ncbi:MAG: VWA domain-containing protein [Thermoguttaceae bacterium]|nr:VWA domain-containing protein [Thermoguttaceae bacterium]
MKQDYIHVCVVLDASGSMGVVENDVKGTFNSFIAEQREQPGKTVLDVYQFSDETTRIVRSADLSTFENDLMRSYRCSGCTALNDAVCQAIDEIGAEFAALPESERPEQVLVAILTDGEENASRRFTKADVKERIDRQTDVYSWKFVFLAANIDAFATGAALGLAADDCVALECSEEGLADVRACFSSRLASMRAPKRR